MTESNMYDDAKTWNPFKGCGFDCVYCIPTFQRQSKRWGKNNCEQCYKYEPHFHPERLNKIPSADIIFVAGSGDISFCPTDKVKLIIEAIKEHNKRCPYKTYYFQSKDPQTFHRFVDELPDNCVLLTTLETDKSTFSDGSEYSDYSKAPHPGERVPWMWALEEQHIALTIEPIMEFGEQMYLNVLNISPDYVWLGFNSKPDEVELPEPSEEEVQDLIDWLVLRIGIEVRGKTLRGCSIPTEYSENEQNRNKEGSA